MPGVPLQQLPGRARTAWLALRDELRRVLGDDLVALWAYGGAIAVTDPAHDGDLDTYAILARRPDEATARVIEAAHAGVSDSHHVEWDAWYVLVDHARRAHPPPHAWVDGRRDTSWAINRAHWMAGRFATLHGPDPTELVQPSTWDELEPELDRELEHVERHVLEGDTDPFEATYAFLNGSRILRSVETRDVAISKRAAGAWALEHLPARWQPSLRAAIRTYDGAPAAGDAELLAEQMAGFVAFVRERLPVADGRAADAVPRWSGS